MRLGMSFTVLSDDCRHLQWIVADGNRAQKQA